MRRFHFLIVSCLAVGTACSDPPKPEKVTDLDKIEPKDGESEPTALGELPSGPIAKVGDVEIPNAEFREIYDLKVKKYTDRGRDIPESAARRYRKSLAERLIYQEVLAQEAKKLGVEVDQAALEEREAQQKRGIRDWDKHLARRGETEESLREMYEAELRERAILEKQGKLEVTEQEIQEDYEKIKSHWTADKPRVRAAHILVPIGPDGQRPPSQEVAEEETAKWEKEAKERADELYKLATAEGADFEELAREHSTGPSAAKGGDIGIFTADRMAEEFSEAAFSMKPGEISKPVKTKFGYHIIKVMGKWPEGELPLEALRDQIVHRLQQRKLHQGRRELKDELLGKYEIVDNIKPTLGPEPQRPTRRATRRAIHPDQTAMKAPRGGPHGPGKPATPEGKAEADGKAAPEAKPDAKAPDPDAEMGTPE